MFNEKPLISLFVIYLKKKIAIVLIFFANLYFYSIHFTKPMFDIFQLLKHQIFLLMKPFFTLISKSVFESC